MRLSLSPVFLLLTLQSDIISLSSAVAVTEQLASILPKFTWLDNYAIHVLFPNGVKDTIKLWPAEKVGDMTIPCLYEGVLEAESPSSLAVSGCQDDAIVQIVIYTNLLPGRTMFNIRNGITEAVEKVTFDQINYVVDESNRGRRRKRGTFLGDDYDDVTNDGAVISDPPPFLRLDVKLAFEESLLAKAGSEDAAREYIARVFTLGKQHMRHATLGTSIRLKAQGLIRKIPNKRWKPIRLDLLESMASKEQENVPITFFCSDVSSNNATGISYPRRGCHENKGVSIVAYREDLHGAAQTYIHECGHGLGFKHDADVDELEGTTCEGTGIMSNASMPGGRPSQWSKCSKLRLKRWLSKPENNCVKPDEKALQLEDVCLVPTVPYDTVVKSKPKCQEVTVLGANYADSNGDYRVSQESVPWSPSRPVYTHVSLDRYIYWSARGHGWVIGRREDLRAGNYYHYSGLDSSEPWEALWRNGITVECKEPPVQTIQTRCSTVHNDDIVNYGPQNSFDGKVFSSNKMFFHSKNENYPWLEIELPLPINISNVTIVNRKDCCGERLKNVEIRAGMNSVPSGTTNHQLDINPVCGMFKGPGATGTESNIACARPILAKFITIQLTDIGILQVNELKVNQQYQERAGEREMERLEIGRDIEWELFERDFERKMELDIGEWEREQLEIDDLEIDYFY